MMRPSWMPSVGDIIFFLLLLLLFVKIPNFIFGDGSTGWHLVAGQYVLDHLQVPRTDLISYTFPDKPWVAYEWLFDTLIAALDRLAGLRLVAVACCAAIAWLFLLLYDECRKRGSHFMTAMVLCVMGALISAIHWLARPHLVTFFALFVFCKYLHDFYLEKVSSRKLMLTLALTTLVWVNCHPQFLMGIVLVGIYLLSDLLVYFCSAAGDIRQTCGKRARTFGLLLLLILAVTLLNPYGPQLYVYIVQYLGQSAVLSQNDEFRSPEFHGQLQSLLLELLYFLLALGLACSRKKPNLPEFLTVMAYAFLSLSARRNMPLFVIVSLPLISEMLANSYFAGLAHLCQEAPAAPWLNKAKEQWQSLGETIDSMEFICTRHALPIAAVLVLAVSCFAGGKALGIQLVSSNFDPKSKPTSTLACLKTHKLVESHGFTFDNWGGYIRYKTGLRVFIDDRSDFYGEKHYLEYADASTIQPNWRDVLNKNQIDWVLFPNNSLLVANLKHETGWKLLCEDEASCLYVRETPALQNSVAR